MRESREARRKQREAGAMNHATDRVCGQIGSLIHTIRLLAFEPGWNDEEKADFVAILAELSDMSADVVEMAKDREARQAAAAAPRSRSPKETSR